MGRRQGKQKLTPYQGKDRVFGEFQCPQCMCVWKSDNSYANTGKQCKKCRIEVYPHTQYPLWRSRKSKLPTPYQGPDRRFGYFQCPKNEKHHWMSGHSWANTGQWCKRCRIIVYPYEQLELSGENSDNKGPHLTHLCQKCKEIGGDCSQRHVHRL